MAVLSAAPERIYLARLSELLNGSLGRDFWERSGFTGVVGLVDQDDPTQVARLRALIGPNLALGVELGTGGQLAFDNSPAANAQHGAQLADYLRWALALKAQGGSYLWLNMESEPGLVPIKNSTGMKEDRKKVWVGDPKIAKAFARTTASSLRAALPTVQISCEALEDLMEFSKLDCYLPFVRTFYGALGGGVMNYFDQQSLKGYRVLNAQIGQHLGASITARPGLYLTPHNTGADKSPDTISALITDAVKSGGAYFAGPDIGEVFGRNPLQREYMVQVFRAAVAKAGVTL